MKKLLVFVLLIGCSEKSPDLLAPQDFKTKLEATENAIKTGGHRKCNCA